MWQSLRSVLCAAAVTVGVAGTVWAQEKARVGLVELEGTPAEQPSPLAWLAMGGEKPTLRQLVEGLNAAARNDSLKGIVIRLKDVELNRTQIEEIGAAIKTLRGAGKKVHVLAEGYGAAELVLASYADEIIVQTGGPVSLPGLYMEEMFLADTLSWIGVKAELVQVGDYKGANEMMTRAKPSPAWESNISQLLDSMYANMRGQLKAGRSLSDEQLDKAMERAWLAEAEDAKEVRLVDAIVDMPDLTDHLKARYKAEIAWDNTVLKADEAPAMDMSNPFAIFSMLSKKPDHKPKRDTIAVVHVDGTIVDGDSTAGGMFGGEGSTGSRTIRNALEEIRKQDLIKGVIVRIDSPGGSATASEVIWQGLRKVAEDKPVWISIGSMAASGGYYCAVAGDKIYVNPSSIVGSIGVVGGKIAMQGLYDKVKLNVVSRSRGPKAALFRSTQPWSAEEIAAVRGKMQQTYDLFTKRVSAGRKGIELGKTAEGRLFTGNVAVGLKMADEVGGLDDAIKDLAASKGLDGYDVLDYPGPKSLEELVQDMLGGFGAKAPGVRGPLSELAVAGEQLLGTKAWKQVRGSLEAMAQLREQRVLLVMPRAIVFE
jgi:protease IV